MKVQINKQIRWQSLPVYMSFQKTSPNVALQNGCFVRLVLKATTRAGGEMVGPVATREKGPRFSSFCHQISIYINLLSTSWVSALFK